MRRRRVPPSAGHAVHMQCASSRAALLLIRFQCAATNCKIQVLILEPRMTVSRVQPLLISDAGS